MSDCRYIVKCTQPISLDFLSSVRSEDVTIPAANYNYNHGLKQNEHLRTELYKKPIKPVLLYSSSTWGLTANDELKLDTCRRKQLRRVIGRRYPDKISNAKLYEKCKIYPISLQITELRWQKFVQILRLDQNTLVYASMLYYFSTSSVGLYKGADQTTIVTAINRDINRAKTFSNEIYTIFPFLRKHSGSLVSAHDIRSFTNIATDRENWQKLKKFIICTAKAG